MEGIDLDSKEVYNILREKKLKYFYHANTVKTSLTFMDSFALLSREYIERNGLVQTEQTSDAKDKEFGIWDFLFLDAMDLADYFSRPNVYGPVLFALDNKLLLDSRIPSVRITKFNPCYWTANHTTADLYYSDLEQFKKSYLTGDKLKDGGTMFIITTINGKLELDNYLAGFRVDSPGINVKDANGNTLDYSDAIINKIKGKIDPKYLDKLSFVRRDDWYFKNIYLWNFENRKKKFQNLFNP